MIKLSTHIYESGYVKFNIDLFLQQEFREEILKKFGKPKRPLTSYNIFLQSKKYSKDSNIPHKVIFFIQYLDVKLIIVKIIKYMVL